jgi:G3E family GTPase
MIPITIITGFLGSGKTTLLNYILKQPHGKKIAVIENEFGEKNIDYEFVLHEKEKIYQMTNGCICCSVREDLVKTLKEINKLSDKFDSIVIETTGVADPSPVLHTLKQDRELEKMYQIESIICLVDAKNFLVQFERSPEVKKQISSANLVVLNKIDLVNDSEVEKIELLIKNYNPDLEILRARYSEVELDKIFLRYLFKTDVSVPSFILKAKKFSLATHEENISSKYFEFSGEINPHYFGIWIDLLFFQCADQLYRMKGILNFKGDDSRVYFQSIHDYLEFSKGPLWGEGELKMNQIVVIGKDLDFNLLESGFQSCVR